MDISTLTLVASGTSIMASGTATVETYRDEDGNEYTAIGGRAAELTRTAAEIARRERMRDIGARARIAADAGDWDSYDAIMAEAR